MSSAAHWCARCSRTLAPDTDVYLCPACVHQLRAWLRELPRQLPLLQESLQLGAGGAGGRGAGRAHAPLPLDLTTLDLLGPGLAVQIQDPHGDQLGGIPLPALLAGWARYIATEHPAVYRAHGTQYTAPCESAAPRAGGTVAGMCGWLVAYLPHTITRPWVGSMASDLEDVVARVRHVTKTTPQRHPRYAPCPACSSFAMVAVDWVGEITCESCGHQLTPEQYQAHAEAVLPELTRTAVRMATVELGEAVTTYRRAALAVPQRRPRLAPCPACSSFALVAVDGETAIVCEGCGHQLTPEQYAAHADTVLPQLDHTATAAEHSGSAA